MKNGLSKRKKSISENIENLIKPTRIATQKRIAGNDLEIKLSVRIDEGFEMQVSEKL